MALVYELMRERSLTAAGLDANRGTLVYKVTATGTDTVLDQAAVRNQHPITLGAAWPSTLGLGDLPGAVCVGKQIIKLAGRTSAFMMLSFSTLRWGAAPVNVLGVSFNPTLVRLPIFLVSAYTQTQQPLGYYAQDPPTLVFRAQMTYRENRVFNDQLTDTVLTTIAANQGCLYQRLGMNWVFMGANAEKSSNGQGRMTYVFQSLGAMLGSSGVPDQLDYPAIQPLDEWRASVMRLPASITVKTAATSYPAGATLP